MKYLIGLIFAIIAMLPLSSLGEITNATKSEYSPLYYYTHSPCDGWRYDYRVSGYTCGFTRMRLYAPEFTSLERVLMEMQKEIEKLRKKQEELEIYYIESFD